MIRTFLAALIYIGLSCVAFAQVGMGGMFPGPGTVHSTGAASPTFTGQVAGSNTSCGFATTCAATVTVTGGLLVVGIGGSNAAPGSSTVSSVATTGACGSTSLTSAVSPSTLTGNSFGAIFYGVVSSGSCTITATGSAAGSFFQMGVAAGTLNNLSSNTPGTTCSGVFNNTGANPYICSSALTISSGGFAVGIFTSTGASVTITPNTSNDASNTAGPSIMIGNATVAGSFTPSFTDGNNFDNVALAGATWR